jgi:hypothetical protein
MGASEMRSAEMSYTTSSSRCRVNGERTTTPLSSIVYRVGSGIVRICIEQPHGNDELDGGAIL